MISKNLWPTCQLQAGKKKWSYKLSYACNSTLQFLNFCTQFLNFLCYCKKNYNETTWISLKLWGFCDFYECRQGEKLCKNVVDSIAYHNIITLYVPVKFEWVGIVSMCGFLFKVAWKINDGDSFKWTFLEKTKEYFTFSRSLWLSVTI